MSVGRLAILLASVSACFAPTVPVGAQCSPAGQCPSGQLCSPDGRCVTSLDDATPDDTVVPGDAAPSDAAPSDGPPSDAPPAQSLIARWRFSGNLSDDTGNHPLTVVGTMPTYGVDGPTGLAIRIPNASSYLVAADSPRFDIASGTIRLRYRLPSTPPSGDLGLFSRDANGTSLPGHLGIRIGHDRRLVVRIQSTTGEAYRCSASAVTTNAWHAVELSFGPGGLVLRHDGNVVAGTAWTDTADVPHDCTGAWTGGIAGNANPIVLGALTSHADDGQTTPITAVAAGVDLDEVEIWANP